MRSEGERGKEKQGRGNTFKNASLSGNKDRRNAPKTLIPDAVQKSARQPGATSGTSLSEMTAASLEGRAY
jgi:hypothetical protein